MYQKMTVYIGNILVAANNEGGSCDDNMSATVGRNNTTYENGQSFDISSIDATGKDAMASQAKSLNFVGVLSTFSVSVCKFRNIW